MFKVAIIAWYLNCNSLKLSSRILDVIKFAYPNVQNSTSDSWCGTKCGTAPSKYRKSCSRVSTFTSLSAVQNQRLPFFLGGSCNFLLQREQQSCVCACVCVCVCVKNICWGPIVARKEIGQVDYTNCCNLFLSTHRKIKIMVIITFWHLVYSIKFLYSCNEVWKSNLKHSIYVCWMVFPSGNKIPRNVARLPLWLIPLDIDRVYILYTILISQSDLVRKLLL